MSIAKKGDKVQVHYKGTLKDGSEFDSSHGRQPLEFELGAGNMIAGFDEAVHGLKVGEKVTVTLPPEKAYGEHREDLVMEFPKDQLPADLNPSKGQKLAMSQPDGRQVPVTVSDVTDTAVVIDANHELAGQELTFEIELVEIA